MKKTYSESELKGLAEKVFEQYPNQNEVFATSDGNVFLMKNRAELHAGSKGNVYPIKREVKTEVVELNAADSIKAIVNAENLEALEAFKADERKSVKAAYTKKVEEFLKIKEVVEAISKAENLEQLEAFKADERESVKDALAAKVAELSNTGN